MPITARTAALLLFCLTVGQVLAEEENAPAWAPRPKLAPMPADVHKAPIKAENRLRTTPKHAAVTADFEAASEGQVSPAAHQEVAGGSGNLRVAAQKAAEPPSVVPAPMPISRGKAQAPLILAKPGSGEESAVTGAPSLVAAMASLAVVVGIFLVLAWLLRRSGSKQTRLLPREAVEVLGRAPFVGRQQVHLVRCGNKILLVSISPAGADTLTEITDPAEVDRLAGLCQQNELGSATAIFRNVLSQFNKEPEGTFANSKKTASVSFAPASGRASEVYDA